MPRFLTPFLAIVAVTWAGGILASIALVGMAQPTSTPFPLPSLSVIVPITTPFQGTAAPSLSTLVPQVSAGSVPSPVAPSGSTATAIATARPSAAPTLPPTAAPTVTLPPETPEPTDSLTPVVTPEATPTPVVTPPPTPEPTPPPAIEVSCGNAVDNSGGLGLICDTTVIVGVSATTTECHGAAGDPRAACSTRTVFGRVTSVSQCNGSANGGGSVLRCSVQVVGGSGPAATVNQCVGSGDGITTGCDPFPATAPNATVTQCNGTANGGTLVGLTCTATGSQDVSVEQCNASGNGGGSLVVCSAVLE